jgi:competence protein ComEA
VKLAPAEAKAVKFVLLIVALSAIARFVRKPEPIKLDTAQNISGGALGSAKPAQNRETPRGPLDPNRASLPELDKLPGVGPATAQRIIAARPLKDLNDLAKVVGARRAKQLAPLLSLRGTIDDRPNGGVARPDSRTSRSSYARDPDQARAARTTHTREPIDLNRATLSELERISGIGPALARRLILKRDSLGRFTDWAQVDAVPGVGPSLLKKLKENSVM